MTLRIREKWGIYLLIYVALVMGKDYIINNMGATWRTQAREIIVSHSGTH